MRSDERYALDLIREGRLEEASKVLGKVIKRLRLTWHTTAKSVYASSILAGDIAKHFGYQRSLGQEFYVVLETALDDDLKPIVIIRPGGERESKQGDA